MLRFRLLVFLLPLFCPILPAQKFYPDDPILKDEDSLNIEKPQFVDVSPTFDIIENTFISPADKALLRALNVNTLGEVPDSSWFENRIGIRDLSIEEILEGGDTTGGPDLSGPLTVIGSSMTAITEGLSVRDTRGNLFYLIFNRKGYPNLATGAGIIASKFFWAFGYNVSSSCLVEIDYDRLQLDPNAEVSLLGGEKAGLDREFLSLFREEIEPLGNGRYRALAYCIPPGEVLGPFKFYGTRPDDPNDVFPHENRRELRGLRVFAAWLNHYLCNSLKTRDFYVTEGGRSFVKHYLVDFTTALGCGYDLDRRIIPKDKQSGNEYTLTGDWMDTLKTAASFGIWERPWMKVDYPSPQYNEIGRFSAEYFHPESWKPFYPNPAFERMFLDDAFWAAKIIARFSDEMIRALVHTGDYSDPAAEIFLADALIERRDIILRHYFRQLNPLDQFRVNGATLEFQNLGMEQNRTDDCVYEYHWYKFDNLKEERTPLGSRHYIRELAIPIPKSSAEYILVRIRSRSDQARQWKKNIEVYLHGPDKWRVVGIDREVGMPALDLFGHQTGVAVASVEFGGTFQNLDAEQQDLMVDWVNRFNGVTGQNLNAQDLYNKLLLSYRTTFEAVTNALMGTPLTDETGTEFGVALDLVDRPRDIVKPVEPVHPDVRIVEHDYEDVFTLAGVPDYTGRGADCSRRLEAGQSWEEHETKTYGNYFVTAFEFKIVGDEAATLYLVWQKLETDWKIVSYHLLTP